MRRYRAILGAVVLLGAGVAWVIASRETGPPLGVLTNDPMLSVALPHLRSVRVVRKRSYVQRYFLNDGTLVAKEGENSGLTLKPGETLIPDEAVGIAYLAAAANGWTIHTCANNPAEGVGLKTSDTIKGALVVFQTTKGELGVEVRVANDEDLRAVSIPDRIARIVEPSTTTTSPPTTVPTTSTTVAKSFSGNAKFNTSDGSKFSLAATVTSWPRYRKKIDGVPPGKAALEAFGPGTGTVALTNLQTDRSVSYGNDVELQGWCPVPCCDYTQAGSTFLSGMVSRTAGFTSHEAIWVTGTWGPTRQLAIASTLPMFLRWSATPRSGG